MMHRLIRTPVEERERGAALIMVIGVGALVMALVTTLIVVAVNGARYARDDVDWNGALAAAYAGIEEYQSRLADDPAYSTKGNPDAPFSRGSVLDPDPANPAFAIDGTWATVVGSEATAGGDRTASFRYEVDSTRFASEQLLRLRSTGRVGDETRSVIVDLRQAGFAHYLYFTDLEIQDPALSTTTNKPECYRYGWSAPSPRPESCGRITFAGNDTVNGMVHSNDVIWACDATFNGRVTTAWNPPGTGKRYRCGSSGVTPRFQVPDGSRGPFYQPVMPMPETNTLIKDAALETGCLYSGPTSIVLRADGRMLVRSPYTRATRPGQATAAPASCGTPAALASSTGALVDVPADGAVYIQNVPANPTDVNHSPRPTGCSAGNALGYPRSNERAPSPLGGTVYPYDCHNGDLFVSGVLDGRVTLATENFLYVVGSTTLEDRDDDMLGLIGNSMVYVWNPSLRSDSCSRNCTYSPRTPDVTIEAAILSLRSFAVQNTDVAGTTGRRLTVYGSIAQSFRGVVSASSGYRKAYNYDPRMRTLSPPHFLAPETIAYGVSTWLETPAAFDAQGVER